LLTETLEGNQMNDTHYATRAHALVYANGSLEFPLTDGKDG